MVVSAEYSFRVGGVDGDFLGWCICYNYVHVGGVSSTLILLLNVCIW